MNHPIEGRPWPGGSVFAVGGVCDSHLHLFGPAHEYPLTPHAVYGAPPAASLDHYLQHVAPIDVARFVLVQPSAYGADNRYLLECLQRLGSSVARAVVELDPTLVNRDQLEAWHALGVRGLRVQHHSPNSSRRAIHEYIHNLEQNAQIAATMGWHLDLLTPIWLTREILDTLAQLAVTFAIPHLALHSGDAREDRPVFERVLGWASQPGSNCWLKLTGFYRLSKDPGYSDVEVLVREAIARAPDRLVWGSDFPHLRHERMADTVGDMRLLRAWIGDDRVLENVLSRNPAVLFDFNEARPRRRSR